MLIRSSHSNLSSKVSDVDLIFITSHLFILYVSQWSPYNKSGLTRIFYSLILVYCWRSFSIWVNTSLALTPLLQMSCVPPPFLETVAPPDTQICQRPLSLAHSLSPHYLFKNSFVSTITMQLQMLVYFLCLLEWSQPYKNIDVINVLIVCLFIVRAWAGF